MVIHMDSIRRSNHIRCLQIYSMGYPSFVEYIQSDHHRFDHISFLLMADCHMDHWRGVCLRLESCRERRKRNCNGRGDWILLALTESVFSVDIGYVPQRGKREM